MSTVELGNVLPLWSCIPFVGMLLSIAIFPLIKPDWWDSHKQYAVIFWSLLFAIPFAIRYGAGTAANQVLESVIGDYLTFIVLLFGLFCVAGNIVLEGELIGGPKLNVIMLALGTLLSSWIGTTGASMVMIRPIIRANSWRSRRRQIIIFFIFMVSNLGGCLTPVGDPPLLMGFMRGVPFFWSLKLFPIMLFNMAVLLIIFYVLDERAYRKDIQAGYRPNLNPKNGKVQLRGIHNIVFLAIIVFSVVLSGILPKSPLFQAADGSVIGIHIYGDVTLTIPSIIEIAIILVCAWLSFKTTPNSVRESNHFSWDAIKEVAILFIGIFITMIPALLILQAKGSTLGLNQPYQMFWMTGALSSFLDNTPTYLVFATTAGSLGATAGIATSLGIIAPKMLMAVSCGAVFMGANTYIGNAPNFMVRSIAEENGIVMPSFFGYMLWSVCILIPVFILDTLIFFL